MLIISYEEPEKKHSVLSDYKAIKLELFEICANCNIVMLRLDIRRQSVLVPRLLGGGTI